MKTPPKYAQKQICFFSHLSLPAMMREFRQTRKISNSMLAYQQSVETTVDPMEPAKQQAARLQLKTQVKSQTFALATWHKQLVHRIITILQPFQNALLQGNIPAIPPLRLKLCSAAMVADLLQIIFQLRAKTEPQITPAMLRNNVLPLWQRIEWHIVSPENKTQKIFTSQELIQKPEEIAAATTKLMLDYFPETFDSQFALTPLPCLWNEGTFLEDYTHSALEYCKKHAPTQHAALLKRLFVAMHHEDYDNSLPQFESLRTLYQRQQDKERLLQQ